MRFVAEKRRERRLTVPHTHRVELDPIIAAPEINKTVYTRTDTRIETRRERDKTRMDRRRDKTRVDRRRDKPRTDRRRDKTRTDRRRDKPRVDRRRDKTRVDRR